MFRPAMPPSVFALALIQSLFSPSAASEVDGKFGRLHAFDLAFSRGIDVCESVDSFPCLPALSIDFE